MSSTNPHILVVAAAAVAPSGLGGAVASLADGSGARIHVVAPALNSRLRHWVSDSDAAHAAAAIRLAWYLDRLAGLRSRSTATSATPIRCRRSTTRSRPSPPPPS